MGLVSNHDNLCLFSVAVKQIKVKISTTVYALYSFPELFDMQMKMYLRLLAMHDASVNSRKESMMLRQMLSFMYMYG